MLRFKAPPPLSLYVHLPWCVRKCPYCDFNSWTMGEDPPLGRYVDALLLDLAAEAERAADRQLVSVFIGGGTPSVFSPARIGTVLEAVANRFSCVDDIEVTMEANPGTVESGDPTGYRAAGVNRLSLGAQSFSPSSLQALGRIHSVDDIRRSFGAAGASGRAADDRRRQRPRRSSVRRCLIAASRAAAGVVRTPSTTSRIDPRISDNDSPRPNRWPRLRLRDKPPVQVNTRSPIPARPRKVSASAPRATPRRVISCRPRVSRCSSPAS